MPGQPVGGVHINAPLSNLARLYRPQESGFIADQVCPRLPVVKESDLYFTFTQGDFYGMDVDDLVADRSAPRRVEFSHATDQYFCERRELAWDVSDRERGNADSGLNLERNKQLGTLGRLMLKREDRVATLLQDTGVTGGGIDSGHTAAAVVKWDAVTTDYQDVLTDVVLGITKLRQAIGIRPNVIVIPAAVAEGLHKSQFFQGAGGAPQSVYSGAPASEPLFTQYPLLPGTLWGMRVLVPGSIKNTANEGATESYSDVWSETVRMLYVTAGPALEIPSVAYTFQSEPLTTRQWRDEERRVDAFAVGFTIDEAVVAPKAGYTITNCLT